MTNTFESIADFARAASSTPWRYTSYNDRSWDAGIPHDKAVQMAIRGDETLPPKAEILLEQLSADVEVNQASWQPSVYGAYPIVPEFLAGSVTPMRHKVLVSSEYAPISVWVDLTCSGGYSAEDMLKRGVAILALVMKLQTVRAVTLNLVSCVQRLEGGLVVKVNSQPLDLATSAFALCAVSFVRHLCYGYQKFYTSDMPISDASTIKRKLSIPDGDLVIPGGHLQDRMIIDNPIEWVQQKVNEFTEGEEN